MQPVKEIQNKSNTLLLTSSISLGLYLILIFDLLAAYEIFIVLLLIPMFLISITFLILLIGKSLGYRLMPKAITTVALASVAITSVLLFGYRSGWFWGNRILNAAFIDDRSRMDLELYQNGKFIIASNWLFGEERFEGTFKISRDTIIFDKYPVVDNDFTAKEIIINRPAKKIYFRKDADGKYDTSFYYFQIDF